MDVVSQDEDMLDRICNREQIQKMRQAINQVLSDQERLVISLRYGLDGKRPHRQREISNITGISRSYVSRIEKRALEKLRSALEERKSPPIGR